VLESTRQREIGWDARPPVEDIIKTRVSALFRRHIATACHPRGVIERHGRCTFCKCRNGCRVGGMWYNIEAHHPDYTKPFEVVWTCWNCHRKIDRGEIKVKPEHIRDYFPLVKDRVRPHLWGKPGPKAKPGDRRRMNGGQALAI